MLVLNKNNKVTKVSGEAARGVERGESAAAVMQYFHFHSGAQLIYIVILSLMPIKMQTQCSVQCKL